MESSSNLGIVSVPRSQEDLRAVLQDLSKKQEEKLKQAGLWPPPKTKYQKQQEIEVILDEYFDGVRKMYEDFKNKYEII